VASAEEMNQSFFRAVYDGKRGEDTADALVGVIVMVVFVAEDGDGGLVVGGRQVEVDASEAGGPIAFFLFKERYHPPTSASDLFSCFGSTVGASQLEMKDVLAGTNRGGARRRLCESTRSLSQSRLMSSDSSWRDSSITCFAGGS
jgi:hypothetical protein